MENIYRQLAHTVKGLELILNRNRKVKKSTDGIDLLVLLQRSHWQKVRSLTKSSPLALRYRSQTHSVLRGLYVFENARKKYTPAGKLVSV